MCHGWLQWILKMLEIPKHTKVHEHHSWFYSSEQETAASVTPTKRSPANLIVLFFPFVFFFHNLTSSMRGNKGFLFDSSKPSFLASRQVQDSFAIIIQHS